MHRTSTRPLRTERYATWAAGMAFAVTALLAVAPAAAATSSSVIVIKRPFTTLPETHSASTSASLCAKAKTTTSPTWKARTGTFKVAGQATAPPCRIHVGQQSDSTWSGSWNTQGNFHFPSNGSHSVTWSWKLNVNASWALPAFNCTLNYNAAWSECFGWAETLVEVGYLIYDSTNFTQFNSGFVTYVQNSTSADHYSQRTCVGSSCSVSGANFSSTLPNGSYVTSITGSTIANMTGTFAIGNSSHAYYMYFTVIAIALAWSYTISAKSSVPIAAAAKVNMGTNGNGFVLGSITIA